MNAQNATNYLGEKWMLAYCYIEPNESFGKRYLVFRPIDVTVTNQPVSPQALILARIRSHFMNAIQIASVLTLHQTAKTATNEAGCCGCLAMFLLQKIAVCR